MGTHWTEIMRRHPIVCPKCSRRFPTVPRNNNCPNHLPTVVKCTDQTALLPDLPTNPTAGATA